LGSTTADSPIDLILDGQRVGRISFRHSSRPRLTTAVAELRRQTHLAIGLLSDRLDATADALAAASGVDFHRGGLSSTEKAGLLRSCRERGLKVVYVGEGRLEPQVVREAHIAISLSDDLDPENVPGHILARTADLAWLPRLLSRARAHVSSVRKVHKAIVFPNLICVGGAFLLGFTSFVSVVITNMGTWAIYSELHRRRRRLELIVPPAGQSRD
jgi:Cu2+-exporting ATPase